MSLKFGNDDVIFIIGVIKEKVARSTRVVVGIVSFEI